jgi:protein-S-isoprenylcysteine O-methyltransferase Ste14
MRALRVFAAFLVLPGIFAFLLPLLIARIDPVRLLGHSLGAAVVVAGVLILLWCVRDFFVQGRGTLAPWDPPRQLVVAGLYRYVRNPMYVGVVILVIGWALVKGSPMVGIYAVMLAVMFHLRVVTREEPWLAERFGTEWVRYASAVPRWLPRLAPWKDRG